MKEWTRHHTMYLRTGYCKHPDTTISKIPHTTVTTTNCAICGKEMNRTYE